MTPSVLPIEVTFDISENDAVELDITDIDEAESIDIGISDHVIVGTNDYEKLKNKPSINDVELIGNKTSEELYLQEMMNTLSFQDIDDVLFGGEK